MRNGDLREHQVDAFFNMAVHGNKTKGGKVKMVNKDGAVKEYTRQKECCPLCPTVTMYLTTHLQRIHKLKRNSDQYTTALQSARNYWGKDAEMILEQQQIQRHQKKRKQDGGRPPKKARQKTGFELLAEELEIPSSDDSSYREGEIGSEDDTQGSGDGCRVVAQRKRMLLRKREKVAEEVAVEGGDDEGEVADEEDDDEGQVADEGDDDEGEVADEGRDDEGGEEEPVYSDEEEDEVIIEMKKRSGKDDSMESEYEDDKDDDDDEEF